MARVTVNDCMHTIPNRFSDDLGGDLSRPPDRWARRRWSGADRDKADGHRLREMAQGMYGLEVLNRGQA